MATTGDDRSLKRRTAQFETVALLFQGGGALGSYQAGVYEALHEAGIEPDWIAGISIGAINCAIIAGNAPNQRLDALHDFWNTVTDAGELGWADMWMGLWLGDDGRRMANRVAAGRAMMAGVPGFYTPRFPPPALMPSGAPGAASYYDTKHLKTTLERLIDFDRINAAKSMRFSVGAVNVRTGNFAYFDTKSVRILPEHIMASGALPPAFEAVEIDGEFYWDGGVVSNTPLDWILNTYPLNDTLAFQVDLWSARGNLPRNLGEVASRLKEVQFSSRTRASTDNFMQLQKVRGALMEVLAMLPPEIRDHAAAKYLAGIADPCVYNIVQLIYKSPPWELQSKDYEFSRATMFEHWKTGYGDAKRTLKHPQIFKRPRQAQGVQTFDFCTNHRGTDG